MKVSFELLEILCNRTLSSKNSDWGAKDGIRVYMMATTTGGDHRVLVGGREYPPPDICDNYMFVPGKTLNLKTFLPHNAPNWTIGPLEINIDRDDVRLVILGINEGLPWIGGGGGYGTSAKAKLKSFEEIAKKASEEGAAKVSAAEAAGHAAGEAGKTLGASAFSAAWVVFEGLIEQLHHTEDCRGVAFLYDLTVNGPKLLRNHLVAKHTTHRLGSNDAQSILAITEQMKISAGCGSPDYEVGFRITRVDDLHMAVDDVPGTARSGPRSSITLRMEKCRPRFPDSEMLTWPVFVDRTITLTPSLYPATLKATWYVDGIELARQSDTIMLTKHGDVFAGDSFAERTVEIEYERITWQGIENLVLKTKGEHGNYRLEVKLRFNFEGVVPIWPDPWADFCPTVVWVDGVSLDGNAAWRQYIRCVIRETAQQAMINYLPVDWQPEKPGPVEIAVLERQVTQFVLPQVLAEHLKPRK